MLRLDRVVAGYGRTMVLQELSLEVEGAEIVAVLGRNGVGKSTMLKTAMGTIPVVAGTIAFDGVRIERLRAHARARRGLAYVPQGREVFPGLTVLENLRVAAYGAHQPGWPERLDEILDEFPLLAERRRVRAGSLSGGQQQI